MAADDGTLPLDDCSSSDAGGGRRQPHLFRLLECTRPLGSSARHSLADLDAVHFGRGDHGYQRRREEGQRRLHVTVPDGRVSARHARLRRTLGRWIVEDQGSRNGTFVNGGAVASAVLVDGDVLELGRTVFVFREAPTVEDEPADRVVDPAGELAGLATLCAPLAQALRALRQVAPSAVSVVIQGESGTGKELAARALHTLSGRPGDFVAINCGAIPQTLVESELFGYRKGAFSEAREDRPGLIRGSDRGTLFLDEIGDLPAAIQPAFLRVLQERQVLPLGGPRPVPVDLRLCAASHRSLAGLVQSGALREDLFARISGFTITLPPLRERREDMGLLVGALLPRLAGDAEAVRFRPEAMRQMLRYPWPRNVRELEKCLEAAVALCGGDPIGLQHLPPAVAAAEAAPRAAAPEEARSRALLSPADAEREAQLRALLARHDGNLSAVAREMGKDRVQIRRWLQRFGLDPESFRT